MIEYRTEKRNDWCVEVYGCDPELHPDGDPCDQCIDVKGWLEGFDSEESARIGAITAMQRLIDEKQIEPSKAWALLVLAQTTSSSINWRDLETVKGETNANA